MRSFAALQRGGYPARDDRYERAWRPAVRQDYYVSRRNAADRQRSQASAVTGAALPQWLQFRLFEARSPSQAGQ